MKEDKDDGGCNGYPYKGILALLQEQDAKPVKPKQQMKWNLYEYKSMQCCGNCTHVLSEKWFYCPGCGRKIDWH
jgi:hypothetical protein